MSFDSSLMGLKARRARDKSAVVRSEHSISTSLTRYRRIQCPNSSTQTQCFQHFPRNPVSGHVRKCGRQSTSSFCQGRQEIGPSGCRLSGKSNRLDSQEIATVGFHRVPSLTIVNGGGKMGHVGGPIVGLRLSTFRGNVRLRPNPPKGCSHVAQTRDERQGKETVRA